MCVKVRKRKYRSKYTIQKTTFKSSISFSRFNVHARPIHEQEEEKRLLINWLLAPGLVTGAKQ